MTKQKHCDQASWSGPGDQANGSWVWMRRLCSHFSHQDHALYAGGEPRKSVMLFHFHPNLCNPNDNICQTSLSSFIWKETFKYREILLQVGILVTGVVAGPTVGLFITILKGFHLKFNLNTLNFKEFHLKFNLYNLNTSNFKEFHLKFNLNTLNFKEFHLKFNLNTLNFKEFHLKFNLYNLNTLNF